MLRKRIWIPIVSVLVIAMGCGLYYGQKTANQEPVKVYKPVEVAPEVSTPKPPPPGETAESGHWHGDVWHAEPHDPVDVSEAEVSQPTPPAELTEVQGAPVVAPPRNAQIIEQAAQDGDIKMFDTHTPEYYEAVAAWKEWKKKHKELRDEYSQLNHAFDDAMPATEEEAKRFLNDEKFKREVQHKMQEAIDKMAEVHRKMREHEAQRPPFPYIP